MNDTLPPVGHAKVGQPECLHIFFQGSALRARVRLNYEFGRGGVAFAGSCAILEAIGSGMFPSHPKTD